MGMAMPATAASTRAPSAHLASCWFKVDMAALRSSPERISGVSAASSVRPEDAGPVKAPLMRLVRVCGGLLLLFPAGGDMATSGYRCRRGAPNHPRPQGAVVTRATVVVRQIRQGA